MADRIRVGEVPGGLWSGALCAVDWDQGGFAPGVWAFGAYHFRRRTLRPDQVEAAWLILTDKLGLGLAGLAARVAQRLGAPDNVVRGGASALVDWLWELYPEWLQYIPRPDPHGRTMGVECAFVASIARYIALTDRLCAAVGLELAEGEVARWERLPTDSIGPAWCLSTTHGHQLFRNAASHKTWLPALRAALASGEGEG